MTEEPKAGKKEKKKPEGLVIPPPKPKLSKAERRALQEQQRAAKAAAKQQQQQPKKQQQQHKPKGGEPKPPPAKAQAPPKQQTPQSTTAHHEMKKEEQQPEKENNHVSIVSHLTPYRDLAESFTSGATLKPTSGNTHLHPAVLKLGYQYASGQIRGGNERCLAMLECFQRVLQDYEPPSSTLDIRHALDHDVLKPSFQYWTQHCRPHSVSMGNAFTFLKTAVASLDRDAPYDTMKGILLNTMRAYSRERIEYADHAIASLACQKLLDDEVILTYGHSQVVKVLLKQQAASNKRFRVIVVDSRPLLEGRQLLHELRQAGIECSYILLNALTYVLQDVTKVLLGASALMSDGSILGRVGTACVALAAHAQHIPVLICRETYKISYRVQLESITGNELGNPKALASTNTNSKILNDETPNLRLLNLLYDLTPASFVSGIVTELGIVPPTSVAVLLREMNSQVIKSF